MVGSPVGGNDSAAFADSRYAMDRFAGAGMILHLLFLVVVVLHEGLRYRPVRLDLLTCFNVTFVLSYPVAALLLSMPGALNPYPMDPGSVASLAGPAYILFWGIFVLFHMSAHRTRAWKVRDRCRPPPVAETIRIGNRVRWWILLSLAGSVWLIVAYSADYGGIEQALRLAGALRAGFVERGTLSFLKRLLPLPALCAHVLFAYLLCVRRKPIFLRLSFLAMLVLAILCLLLLAGRARLIFFGMGFLLIYTVVRVRLPRTAFMVSAVLGIFILAYGKLYFGLLSYKTDITAGEVIYEVAARQQQGFLPELADVLVSETSHFYVSLEAAVAAANDPSSYRFFHDVPVALADLLPQAVLAFELPPKVAYLNTQRVLGIWESIVPPGLVAYSLMNIGMLGLVLTPALLGLFTGRLERLLLANLAASPMVATAYSVFLLLFGYDIIQGEPGNFISGGFVRLCFLGAVCVFVLRFRMRSSRSSACVSDPGGGGAESEARGMQDGREGTP